METIRTPDNHFKNLPGYPFQPQYIELSGLRIHYVTSGDDHATETVLCIHGEPTWSYLYRKMIPILATDYRVIAPDFVGFGRSDKLTNLTDYTFSFHLEILKSFIEKLNLDKITVVVQDWGGLIGLTTATQMAERFSRLVVMNTFLPVGRETLPDAFIRWREFARRMGTRLPIGRVIKSGLAKPDLISSDVLQAYEAPFPDERFKAGAAAWPLLVPVRRTDPGAAEMAQARRSLRKWHKPALVLFSDSDPIMRGGDKFFRKLIPTAVDQPEILIEQAGHFLQEEKGEEIGRHIQAFIKRSPVNTG